MHQFRTLLSKFLRETNWTQQHLASQLDADQATVSRWLSGRVQMGGQTLKKLLTLLPDDRKSELLEAYLRDQIPAGFEYLVDLKPTVESDNSLKPKASELAELPKTMDPDLRKRLVYFAQIAMNSPEVRKLIDVVFKLTSKGKA
jgi:transcriptional regulator with XRE-family HTH domain